MCNSFKLLVYDLLINMSSVCPCIPRCKTCWPELHFRQKDQEPQGRHSHFRALLEEQDTHHPTMHRCINSCLDVSNGDLNLYSRLNGDGGDLLHHLGGGLQVDEALVDAHLKAVPGLGTLTARGLTGGDLQDLGGHADGALDLELLLLGAADEVGADLLQVAHVAGGQGNADTVDLGHIGLLDSSLSSGLDSGCHFCKQKRTRTTQMPGSKMDVALLLYFTAMHSWYHELSNKRDVSKTAAGCGSYCCTARVPIRRCLTFVPESAPKGKACH